MTDEPILHVFSARIGDGYVAYDGCNPVHFLKLIWDRDATYPEEIIAEWIADGHRLAFGMTIQEALENLENWHLAREKM